MELLLFLLGNGCRLLGSIVFSDLFCCGVVSDVFSLNTFTQLGTGNFIRSRCRRRKFADHLAYAGLQNRLSYRQIYEFIVLSASRSDCNRHPDHAEKTFLPAGHPRSRRWGRGSCLFYRSQQLLGHRLAPKAFWRASSVRFHSGINRKKAAGEHIALSSPAACNYIKVKRLLNITIKAKQHAVLLSHRCMLS